MTLVDVSRPIRLSPRAAEQVAKQEGVIEQLEAQRKVVIAKINGIVDNDRLHAGEGDAGMTERLRRYRTYQGKAQVRFHLTGDRKKGAKRSQPLKAFNYIYRRCKGSGFQGTEIAVAEIAEYLGVKTRQAQYILDRLENQTHHRAFALHGPKLNPGVIVRLPNPGGESRFAVTLPESNEYLKELGNAFEHSAYRQEKAEAAKAPEVLPIAA